MGDNTRNHPPGDYCILELFGHMTLVGRFCEVERFGTKMLAIEPLFNSILLPAVFHPVSQGAPSNAIGGRGIAFFAHSGRSCCSMYCLMTDSGAPPHEITQYDRLQSTGLR